MKKTKGAKLIKRLYKIVDKIRKVYAVGTKVRYVCEHGSKDEILTITCQDIEDIKYVKVFMNNEYLWVNISNLEIVE